MIPMRLLPSTCDILAKTSVQNTTTGQQDDTWSVVYEGWRGRHDGIEGKRYVSPTADMEQGTDVWMANAPLPVPLSVKNNKLRIDSVDYRILSINAVQRLLNAIDHYEITLVRYS